STLNISICFFFLLIYRSPFSDFLLFFLNVSYFLRLGNLNQHDQRNDYNERYTSEIPVMTSVANKSSSACVVSTRISAALPCMYTALRSAGKISFICSIICNTIPVNTFP